MTTTPTLKLVRGSKSIDLSTSPYAMGKDFEIPSLSTYEVLSNGSSANVYSGSIRTSIKYNSRKWSFSVRVNSTTDGAVRLAIRDISQFLLGINDNEMTYIEYRVNSDTPEPLWGTYGTAQRYEVISGSMSVWPEYSIKDTRSRSATVTLNLTIGPFALGRKMQICAATGGIQEDTKGSVDGRSFGLMVPLTTVNYHTNPVFGNATYDTSWATGSSLIKSKITDPNFIPFGYSSVKLTATAATNNTFTESLALGATTHTASYYVMLPDKSAVSSTQVEITYNGSTQTTAYTLIGNGLYLLTASFTGSGGAASLGVIIKNKYTIILCAGQLEASAYASTLSVGDMLGHTWSGTIHASASTRTASSCKISIASDTLFTGKCSFRAIVRFDVPNTHPSNMVIFDTRDAGHTTSILLYYDQSTDRFILSDSSASALSTAQTFSARTTYVIHGTFGAGGIALYINGAADGTAAFVPPSSGANLFIGSSYQSLQNVVGAIVDFTTWSEELTATQVLNDYTNIIAALTNGEKIGSIPWFWTDDGDNILSLDTGKKPLGVVGGVPGSAPAITEMQGALSSNWSTIKSIALSNYACDAYIGLGTLLYDYSGTAAAGDYGGQHLTTTVNGSGIVLSPANPVLSSFIANQINGMEFYIFTRLYGSAATQFLLYSAWSNSSSNILSLSRVITPAAGSAYRMFITDMSKVESDAQNFTGTPSTQVSFYMYGSKIASNVDISVDYISIMPRPVLLITGGTEAKTGFVVKGFSAYHSASGYINSPLNTIGDAIEFAPNKFNHFQCHFCPDGTVDPVTTYQATFSAIYITPRWALL